MYILFVCFTAIGELLKSTIFQWGPRVFSSSPVGSVSAQQIGMCIVVKTVLKKQKTTPIIIASYVKIV